MTQQQREADGERPPAVDIWRDSLVRYLGYSNELGESFRPIVPRLVVPSYAVAFAYVLGDTFDKASKAEARAQTQRLSDGKRRAVVADATVDTLLWQTMASVAIPGFTINRVVKICAFAVVFDVAGVALSSAVAERTVKNLPLVRRWVPTAIGLGVIPLIIHPIDHLVDQIMDSTTRKWAATFLDKYDK